MSETARDPRVDPVRGDELSGGKSIRWVGLVKNGEVGFTYWGKLNQHGTGNDCFTSLKNWRKWAKDAEIIKRGDE